VATRATYVKLKSMVTSHIIMFLFFHINNSENNDAKYALSSSLVEKDYVNTDV